MKNNLISIATILFMLFLHACNSENNKLPNDSNSVLLQTEPVDSCSINSHKDSSKISEKEVNTATDKNISNKDQSAVLIYNFHVTNRCVPCIAIEEATTKTLNKYFSREIKQGRIKRQILNVDDEANSKIAEKYQAFGSSMFVTKVIKGKETTSDLTGDGFKYAKNKEEKFIEELKNKISEYLK
jgi:hypothetical protein